jgi:DNA replication protein DnaC
MCYATGVDGHGLCRTIPQVRGVRCARRTSQRNSSSLSVVRLYQPSGCRSLDKLLSKIARTDVLVVDDWAMAPLSEPERRDFLEICDDRYQTRSTILTSQIPVAHWHERIGEPTLADSILDRLVHNAYQIELKGPSMRKLQAGLADKGGEESQL